VRMDRWNFNVGGEEAYRRGREGRSRALAYNETIVNESSRKERIRQARLLDRSSITMRRAH
jgi:hypothetical protein